MSEFRVHRTADTIPALKYCLILDGERIAGGKPDYRGNNHLITWNTRETYGPIDQLKAENRKLWELARGMYGILATFDAILGNHDACETPRPLIFGENKSFKDVMRELGAE